ncbi:hypothetical protein [Paenibacillus sp. GCM10012306]|uniref:hypothetical protein n=1 Tax=Paenibacillus sp. GCM10012306 TaxID=3317342 RepID=UPI00360E60C2
MIYLIDLVLGKPCTLDSVCGAMQTFLKRYLSSSDADLQDVSLDSTSCKAHQHAAGAKKGLETSKQTKKSGFPVVDEIPKSTP